MVTRKTVRFLLIAVLSIATIFLFIRRCYAEELKEDQVYRLERPLINLSNSVGSGKFTANRPSKFVVISNDNKDYYLIRFLTVYDFKENGETKKSTVKQYHDYRLPRNFPGIIIEKCVKQAFSGPVSGPLVVPFKYRLNNGTITGESTLGYYAGYSFDILIPTTDFRIPVIPFISGGLTQLAVDNNGDGNTESRSGVSIAIGLLIKNWGDLTLGIVWGQDRIGDPSYKNEGKNWISFMVGWEI